MHVFVVIGEKPSTKSEGKLANFTMTETLQHNISPIFAAIELKILTHMYRELFIKCAKLHLPASIVIDFVIFRKMK